MTPQQYVALDAGRRLAHELQRLPRIIKSEVSPDYGPRTCPSCRETFTAHSPNARYCSLWCAFP